MGILTKLFPPPKPAKASGKSAAKPAGRPTAAELSAQRQALAERLITPEREALIARALEVQRSKQQVFDELASQVGQERMAEAIKRMMEKG